MRLVRLTGKYLYLNEFGTIFVGILTMKKFLFTLLVASLLSACQNDCWLYTKYSIHNACADTIRFIASGSYFGSLTIPPNGRSEIRGERIACGDMESAQSEINPKDVLKHNVTINFSDGSCLVYNLYNTKQTRSPLVLDNYNWDGNLTFEYIITEDDHQTAIEACGM